MVAVMMDLLHGNNKPPSLKRGLAFSLSFVGKESGSPEHGRVVLSLVVVGLVGWAVRTTWGKD